MELGVFRDFDLGSNSVSQIVGCALKRGAIKRLEWARMTTGNRYALYNLYRQLYDL